MNNKAHLSIFIFIALFAVPFFALANMPTVYFFYGDGDCPNCVKEQNFLSKLQGELPELEIKQFEVWHDSDNIKLLQDIGDQLDIKIAGVPFAIVGDSNFTGFDSEENSGKWIRDTIERCDNSFCPDLVASFLGNRNTSISEKGGLSDGAATSSFWSRMNSYNFFIPGVIAVVFLMILFGILANLLSNQKNTADV